MKARSNGVRAPFGYYVDENDQYQIDEGKAPIVKEIFTLYADGKKITEIVEIMKARGVQNRGYTMNYNAIFRILTNRKYIGEYKFGDVVIPNGMPAIVDEDIFNKIQARMKRNKKAPAMHRSEDDYLLTTHLFCGKCGAMMTGEIGTSKTARQYRYYKCNRAKKKQCDKKTVRKEWLEDLVIATIMELITVDDVIEELADRIFDLQNSETHASVALQAQIAEVDKKLNNLIEAMAQGIFSQATKKVLDDLEEQKKNLEIELFRAEVKNPLLTKEQILFSLYNYRKLDLTTTDGRQRLIDGFVNSIYLYDDHFIITFNYKNQSKTVSFDEVNSSSLTSTGSPFRHTKKERRQTLLFCVFFRFFGLFWAFFAEKILFILFDIRAGRDLFPSSFFSSFRIFQKIFFIRSFRSCRLYKSALCFSQGALCLFFHEKSYRFKVILS